MDTLTSRYNPKNINPPIEVSKVTRIVLETRGENVHKLWAIFFHGKTETGAGQIIGRWFYQSEALRHGELDMLRERLSGVVVD